MTFAGLIDFAAVVEEKQLVIQTHFAAELRDSTAIETRLRQL